MTDRNLLPDNREVTRVSPAYLFLGRNLSIYFAVLSRGRVLGPLVPGH